MKYTPYSQMIEIPLVGQLPEDWESRRLKFCISYNDESLPENTEPDTEISYVDISSVNLVEGITFVDELTFEKAPSRARRIVRDGDTIVSTVRTYLKAIAAINDPPQNMIVSTGFAVIRPKDIVDSRYLSYFLQSQNFVDTVVANSVGVSYPAINASDLVCIPIAYPKKMEAQNQIAAFLDHKTIQIDHLIEKKKALIEKLNEKRIALITQAVTKGLNPEVPMKPSGVVWLGDVPLHWYVSRLRWFVRTGSGDFLSNEEMEMTLTEEMQVPVIGGNGTMAFTNLFNTLPRGIVVGRVGAHCGNVHLIHMKCWVTDNALRVKIIDTFNDEYLYWVLLSMRLNDDANRNAQPLITGETIKIKEAPIPPIKEQIEIASYIDRETNKIKKMIHVINLALERLAEYRTALITAAVTGKIDVRAIDTPDQEAD